MEGFVRPLTAQWLELHGLDHWTHFYSDYGVGLQRRFFAHFLQGEDAAWRDRQPVQLQIRHLDGFIRRAEHDWPMPGPAGGGSTSPGAG